ncbi:hypothetical protein QBC43DRAFT_348557 [Cladorrhinum sp. PSN259]|nr:hypothetical protein QBC43DRAFT_348557 [Cladorrhinum sp. PSN259]
MSRMGPRRGPTGRTGLSVVPKWPLFTASSSPSIPLSARLGQVDGNIRWVDEWKGGWKESGLSLRVLSGASTVVFHKTCTRAHRWAEARWEVTGDWSSAVTDGKPDTAIRCNRVKSHLVVLTIYPRRTSSGRSSRPARHEHSRRETVTQLNGVAPRSVASERSVERRCMCFNWTMNDIRRLSEELLVLRRNNGIHHGNRRPAACNLGRLIRNQCSHWQVLQTSGVGAASLMQPERSTLSK